MKTILSQGRLCHRFFFAWIQNKNCTYSSSSIQFIVKNITYAKILLTKGAIFPNFPKSWYELELLDFDLLGLRNMLLIEKFLLFSWICSLFKFFSYLSSVSFDTAGLLRLRCCGKDGIKSGSHAKQMKNYNQYFIKTPKILQDKWKFNSRRGCSLKYELWMQSVAVALLYK